MEQLGSNVSSQVLETSEVIEDRVGFSRMLRKTAAPNSSTLFVCVKLGQHIALGGIIAR